MNIIANDCVGGELYKICNEEYKSPFIWTILRISDFKEVMLNYDNIDFMNIRYEQTPNYYFPWYMSQLVVDDKFKIFFPHHMLMKGEKQLREFSPIPNQHGMIYEKMDEYIIEHYRKRIGRMTEEPVFVFSQENRNDEKEIIELLEMDCNLLTTNIDYKKYENDRIKIIIKPVNEILQREQAEWIKNKYKGVIF